MLPVMLITNITNKKKQTFYFFKIFPLEYGLF